MGDVIYTKPIIRAAYSERHREEGTDFGKSRTKQSFKDEADINLIMSKYQKTGLVTHLNDHQPQYGFATNLDFREALELVQKAEQMFDDLPSSIRAKFENNPAKFLSFVEDPANRDEMAILGLLKETPEPVPASGPGSAPETSEPPAAESEPIPEPPASE